MGAEDLREIWGRITADSSGQPVLDENQIRSMLKKRSGSLMEKIDFNIRVGFAVLLGIVMFIVVYDLLSFTGHISDASLQASLPQWLLMLDGISNFLILSIFVTFFLHYFRIRRLCQDNCDLRHALMKVIGILTIYQRLFVVLLFIIMIFSITGFAAGYYTSILENQTMEGFLIPVILFGVLVIALLTWLIFLLLRWIFRRVYGNYLDQLRNTLAELDELE
ncbi:MAG TPA: hypothetical protein PKJ24_03405 [Prolixibacteraceae bacterium]|nr:hypothetical protein [Prolixibacteraceae bacterium]HPT30693.1 hypothetical protein [Prolixibacteraceae bacterium]